MSSILFTCWKRTLSISSIGEISGFLVWQIKRPSVFWGTKEHSSNNRKFKLYHIFSSIMVQLLFYYIKVSGNKLRKTIWYIKFITFLFCTFKVLPWSNSRYPFFNIFVHNRCVQDILQNFNLLRTTELFFLTFLSENLRPPLIFLVPSLGWELEKMTSFSQKYHTGWNYNNN